MSSIIKVVITGPESTGKSSLCAALAEHYNTLWVPEFAREYLEKQGPEYQYDDLKAIAKGQVQAEKNGEKVLMEKMQKENSNAPAFLFVDTSMYVMKIWSEYVFGKCDFYILDQLADDRTNAYLLCNTDLPWQSDPLRAYPNIDERKIIFKHYKDALAQQQIPWTIISGMAEARVNHAIDFLNNQF